MYNTYIFVDKIDCMANIHMHLSLTARGSYPKQTEYWQMLKSKQFFFPFVKCRVRKSKKIERQVKKCHIAQTAARTHVSSFPCLLLCFTK